MERSKRALFNSLSLLIFLSLIFTIFIPNVDSDQTSTRNNLSSNDQDGPSFILDTRTESNFKNLPAITDHTVVYAIICPQNLTNALEPLATWKTRKGVPSKIYTTNGPNGIYSNYTNGDNATRIHDFLTVLHKNNPNLAWVLIVGDEDIIPSRKVFVNASKIYGLDDYYYSDHYYAGLNNSWDQDGDGIYGEQTGDVNWNASLYVGRLPVNNASETEHVVNRIIEYETTPEIGQWQKNATFWAGLLDGPNNLSAYQSYKDNAMKVTNKIIDSVPDHMKINILYDYNQLEPGNYSYTDDILNHQSGKESFYSGNSFINFAGQAYYTGDELAHYIDVTGLSAAPDGFGPLFSYNDAKYAKNGEKLPLVYLSTCSVNFSETDDSNLEQLLTSTSGGAIGLIGNSGRTYRGETSNGSSYGNWWLDQQFWEMFFSGMVQPGKCLYELKKSYVLDVIQPGVPYIRMAVANLVGYNLLGDPELNIWTDIPKQLNYTYELIKESDYKLKIQVTNESGGRIDNALVCVYNSEIYEYVRTNKTGHAVLEFDPRLVGKLDITVTAHNYLPLFSNFTYKNKPPEFGIINDVEMNEDDSIEDYISLRLYVQDLDTNFEDLTFKISNVTDFNAFVKIDKKNNIDIKPFLNWHGEAIVTLEVSDGIDTDTTIFKVTVKPVNDPPEINEVIENQELLVGETFKYFPQTSDIDKDMLTFSDDTKLFDIDENTGEIYYKAIEQDVGKHEVRIFVSDGNATAQTTFKIEIIKEPTIYEIFWFPIVVSIITLVLISIIKIYSITHPEKPEKDKVKKEEKTDKKRKKGNNVKASQIKKSIKK
jgi:hypothetical protein